jgi:quercetin dioxygenase-like cupin family protein
VRIGLIAAALIALACPALAGENHTTFYSEEIKFAPNNAFPPGAETAVLLGDAAKPGLFIIQVKLPPNYKMPIHTHPGFETVVLLKGKMGVGSGTTYDQSSKLLSAGSTFLVPANHPHYNWTTDEETIFQVTVNAPFDLIYLNPAEDPRKK